jgi:broad specificity phosphatase PhoE
MLQRTQKFCQELKKFGADKPKNFHLCLVSHGITLSILLLALLTEPLTTPEVVRVGLKNLKFQNTGLSIVRLEDNHFTILTINDFAHL